MKRIGNTTNHVRGAEISLVTSKTKAPKETIPESALAAGKVRRRIEDVKGGMELDRLFKLDEYDFG